MQVDLKRIKPIGIVLILGGSLMALILCFTGNLGIPERYVPAHDASYYQQSEQTLSELMDEVTANEFPRVDGEETCRIDTESMTLIVSTDSLQVDKLKAVLERDFGTGLFQVLPKE